MGFHQKINETLKGSTVQEFTVSHSLDKYVHIVCILVIAILKMAILVEKVSILQSNEKSI